MLFGRSTIAQSGLGGYRLSATPIDLRYKIGGVTFDWADILPIQGRNAIGTISVDATGGTFTLSYGGQTTGNIAEAATAATVEEALESLSTIGNGNIMVSGSAGGPWTYEFIEDMRHMAVTAITGNGANLTGGTTVVTVTATQTGLADGDETLPGGVTAKFGTKVLRAGTTIYRKPSGLYGVAASGTTLARGETFVVDKHYFQEIDGDLIGEVFDSGVVFKDRLLVGGSLPSLTNVLAAMPSLRLHTN